MGVHTNKEKETATKCQFFYSLTSIKSFSRLIEIDFSIMQKGDPQKRQSSDTLYEAITSELVIKALYSFIVWVIKFSFARSISQLKSRKPKDISQMSFRTHQKW